MYIRWSYVLNIKYVLLILLVLVGCSQAKDTEESVLVTVQSVATTQIPTTPIPVTPTFTLTPIPVPSPIIDVTETPGMDTKNPDLNSIALSNVAVQERGGVVVEIAWIFVVDKYDYEQENPEGVTLSSSIFDDKQVVAWIIFNITNNSGKDIHLHPRRGRVTINDEQIDLSEYRSYTSVDEKFNGSYSPGERAVGGGVWFGIRNSDLNDIDHMIITMHGPHFPEEEYYAENYYFMIDLTNHIHEEFPDYLK